MSSQKISTKKGGTMQQHNQLASDRIRGIRESSNSRKNVNNTVIGTNGKRTVLNSSQIQMKNNGSLYKSQAQSMSRSRGGKTNSQAQGATRSGGGALTVIGGGNKNGVGVFPLNNIVG